MEMTITTKEKRYTVNDYLKLEEGAPFELINGNLVKEPAPSYGHQDCSAEIFTQIRMYTKLHDLGKALDAPLDVYFDEHNVLQPDIVYVATERLSIIHENGIHGAPDMIIEILSPSTTYYDTKEKKNIYEKYGVKELWIIDPTGGEVTGYENINGKYNKFYHGYDRFKSKALGLEIVFKS